MELIDRNKIVKVLYQHVKDCVDARDKTDADIWEYMRQAYVKSINEIIMQPYIIIDSDELTSCSVEQITEDNPIELIETIEDFMEKLEKV